MSQYYGNQVLPLITVCVYVCAVFVKQRVLWKSGFLLIVASSPFSCELLLKALQLRGVWVWVGVIIFSSSDH